MLPVLGVEKEALLFFKEETWDLDGRVWPKETFIVCPRNISSAFFMKGKQVCGMATTYFIL